MKITSRAMLCYMVISIAPLTGGYSEALSAECLQRTGVSFKHGLVCKVIMKDNYGSFSFVSSRYRLFQVIAGMC